VNIETKSIIRKYKLKLTKRLGQNFLVDESVIRDIVQSAEVAEDDLVIEIGLH